MYPANSHVIRPASASDRMALRRLATHAGQSPLRGHVLIGEIKGRPAAAVSLDDLRVISDGSEGTERLTPILLMRARATIAHRAEPSVRERVIALLSWGRSADTPDAREAA